MHCFTLELSTLHLKFPSTQMDFYFDFFYLCYHCFYCNRIFISFPFVGQGSCNQATWTWMNRRIKLSWQFSRMIYSLLSMLWRNHWYKNECACNHNRIFSFQIHLRIPNANTNLRIWLSKLFPQLMKSWRFYGCLNVHLPKSIISSWIRIIFFSMSWTISS